MISKLLIGKQIEARIEAAEKIIAENSLTKNHPDVLWMDDEKLGVEQAKQIRQFLSLKPYSAKGRVVVVLNAHNFTLDAQNSLLKTLEEPPVEAIILLAAENGKKILETVLSRCETVNLNESEGSQDLKSADSSLSTQNDIQDLLNSSLEERFEFIEKLEDKDEFFSRVLTFFHEKLPNHPEYVDFAKDLLKAEAWKESNGNIRAILEYLMIKMPK